MREFTAGSVLLSVGPAPFQMVQSWTRRWRKVAPRQEGASSSDSFLDQFTHSVTAGEAARGNEPGAENLTFCFGLIAGYFTIDTSKSYHYWVRSVDASNADASVNRYLGRCYRYIVKYLKKRSIKNIFFT